MLPWGIRFSRASGNYITHMTNTVTPEQLKWGNFGDREGCFHLGTLKVGVPDAAAPFAEKIVALVAAAEGGAWNSMNMYDRGLLSLGAIQFIDVAPQFFVTDMLDSMARTLGGDVVQAALKPALDLVRAEFKIEPVSGKYRYFLDGKIVATKLQQNILYFGDGTGNVKGAFDPLKRKICRTWGACIMNLMTLDGAVDVQAEYTYKRILTTFLWGKAKPLFNQPGLAEYGWQAAIRALVVSYAVNSPATAMRRVDAFLSRTKEPAWSPIWCLEMLRSVAVEGGINIWSDRYKSQIAATKAIFGIELPSWNDLAARRWTSPLWVHPCLKDVSPPSAPAKRIDELTSLIAKLPKGDIEREGFEHQRAELQKQSDPEISEMVERSLQEHPVPEAAAVEPVVSLQPLTKGREVVTYSVQPSPSPALASTLLRFAWAALLPIGWVIKWIFDHFKKH